VTRRGRLVVALFASIGLCGAAVKASVAGETAHCDDTGDPNYLQNRFDNSQPGEVITLADGSVCNAADLQDGPFVLPSHQIMFQGTPGGAPEILDGGNQVQILLGVNVGSTVIRNLTFVDGSSSDTGGAIAISGNSAPTISNSAFFGNSANGHGGAVWIRSTSSALTSIEQNQFGGPLGGNSSTGQTEGGALYVDTVGDVRVWANTFAGNTAARAGGGATLVVCGLATVEGNVFSGNRLRSLIDSSPGRRGGGLSLEGLFCGATAPRATQTDNRFTANIIEAGAGFSAGAGEAIAGLDVLSTNDRFVDNTIEAAAISPAEGGGPVVDRAGGGLWVGGSNRLFEGRNLVAASNEIQLGGEGGGIFLGPSAGGAGPSQGGVGGSALRLFDSTVVANVAAEGSGIAGGFAEDLTLHNGIVFGNTGAPSEILRFDGVRDVQFSDVCAGADPHVGAGNICADPQLVAPSAGDVHQTLASPTIDAGSDARVPAGLTQDYEGNGRILSARVDMGADESFNSADLIFADGFEP
jgi:hypothetical protein